MENLRSLEPQAKISHSYKTKECSTSVQIGSVQDNQDKEKTTSESSERCLWHL